ncbi:MAG: hypothetical protein QF903_06195 [Planctomycetota bacterium]|jgi:dienelactone hydrolase|nr:hypothetical protein [Planctomycetota bacterium]MDP6763835.1 hypothetical protein [Planctomycetota bacterium]MDP6989051.1 hypothetical protein [Planctomycetota bacterium]
MNHSTLLGALLASGVLLAGAAGAHAGPQGGRPLRRARAVRPAPPADDFETRVNGVRIQLGNSPIRVAAPLAPNVYPLTFNDTGTTWQEPVLLGVPRVPLPSAPLLVMFHSFGISESDCVENTGLMKRALDRGWYVLAPRGAHDMNFGIPYSQANIEFVLDWLVGFLSIDTSRIYGVGFSMGGGGVTSYAARHLDPTRPMLAAVANHTGGVSVAHTYWNESSLVQDILENLLMFGASPAIDPFAYSQVSAIDVDPVSGAVDPTTDMARNLAGIPFRTSYATLDPLAYLMVQSAVFHDWMTALPASSTEVQIDAAEHAWTTLDETAVLDFLESKTLAIPRGGTHRLLADREGVWMHFTVEQDAADAFTPLRWNLDASLNRLIVDQTENLARITADTASLGLDTQVPLTVIPGTQDGLGEELRLTGYGTMPSNVLRNGQATSDWAYDANTGTVTLFESSAAGYPQWVIVP